MLEENLQHLIEEQAKEPGIDVRRLKPGVRVIVNTMNSEYVLETTEEPGIVYAQGGKHIPHRRKVGFNGSTFGGSMIKVGWIGRGMHMEFQTSVRRILTTSSVRRAVVQGDGWSYELEW
jgi:hypothetical protein